MGVAILQILAGFALLTFGADALVRGAAGLARRLGISPLVVGLTVVAFGTSAPELVVCLKAALTDNSGLAIGNAVGSNIFNLAAILGLSALVTPVVCQAAVVRREVPIMIGAGGLLLVFALTGGAEGDPERAGTLARWEGGVLFALAVGYTGLAYYISRRERLERGGKSEETEPLPGVASPRGIWVELLLVTAGGTLLAVGAEVLVSGAVTLATLAGVSDLVIGLTVVGAGTGLPELATSVVAALKKEPDISLGNLVGSSIFNILLILGATALVAPLDVASAVLARDLPVMLVLFLVCLPMMHTGSRVSRIEGGCLLGAYVAYLVLVVVQSVGS